MTTCTCKSSVLSTKNGSSRLDKLEVLGLAMQHHYTLNKGFKKAQEYMDWKAIRNKENKPASNIKHKYVTHVEEKGIMVRIVQMVTFLSQIWSIMFIQALGGPQMVLVQVG